MGQGAKKQRPFPDGHAPQQGAEHQLDKTVNDRFWLVRVIADSQSTK